MTSSDSLSEASYRQAHSADLPAIARVFAAAFPDSVEHATGGMKDPEPLTGIFTIALEAEPEGLMVAEVEGEIAGYVLATQDPDRLKAQAWRGGQNWHLLWNWLRGAYGPRWRVLRAVATDKISFWRNSRRFGTAKARMLSMAVAPRFQGRGLGSRLFERGMQYLESRGVRQIRLEVRPDNLPARRLYETRGFVPVGTYRDSRGEWLVMIRTTPSEAEKPPSVRRAPPQSTP